MTLAQGAGLNETVVGVAVLVVAGLLFALVLRWKSGEDMTKALGVLGTLFGSVIAGTGTYFFTKPAIEEAQAGREAAESRAVEILDTAEEALDGLRDSAKSAGEAWLEIEKGLATVSEPKKLEYHRILLRSPAEFGTNVLPTLKAENAPAVLGAVKSLEDHAAKVKAAEGALKRFRRK